MKRTALLIAAHLLASPIAAPADAHDWYDRECCHAQDCQPIPTAAIRWSAYGYIVTLTPQIHRQVKRSDGWLVRFPDVRRSLDGRWHACVRNGALVCLYGPPAGG